MGIKTAAQLAAKAVEIAKKYKTMYILGCFGAPMNATNKKRYANNGHNGNRIAAINAASADTFGFDCVCLIKGILWGWSGDTSMTYGGATYNSNGVPDIGADQMIKVCSGVSTDFSKIEIGEVVWMTGHIGIYIGGGLAVEASPKWENKVQITACNNARSGYNRRDWTKHGKLPYVSYTGVTENVKTATAGASGDGTEIEYTVVKGDTLSAIAQRFGFPSYQVIAEYNGIRNPNAISVGQKIRIPQAEAGNDTDEPVNETIVVYNPAEPEPAETEKPVEDELPPIEDAAAIPLLTQTYNRLVALKEEVDRLVAEIKGFLCGE